MIKNLPLVPEQASSYAAQMDPLFWVLVTLTVLFAGTVLTLLLFFAIRYRRGAQVDRSNAPDEHQFLEITWTVIPLLLGLGVFVWGAKLYAGAFGPPPANALEIFVVGKQWMWHIQHSNGIRENNELHVPLGRPIALTMISQDVIHDFYVPEFRIHVDVVPGRYTREWFTPIKIGRYRLFCAQYCGTDHSKMTGWVTVMDPADYARWLANGGQEVPAAPKTMAALGADLYQREGCAQCHDPGAPGHGPVLTGLYGSIVTKPSGEKAVADAAYLREQILTPVDRVAPKYQQIMPSYKGQLTEEQVLQLIAYIKSLGPQNPASAEPAPAPKGASARVHRAVPSVNTAIKEKSQ